MTTTEQTDYSMYQGKRVSITHKLNGTEELAVSEGEIVGATGPGILFKEKGKSTSKMIFAFDVTAIEVLTEETKTIKSKALAPIKAGSVKQHLADRHGSQLSYLATLTEEQAVEVHDKLHENLGKDLGHFHKAEDTEPGPDAAVAA